MTLPTTMPAIEIINGQLIACQRPIPIAKNHEVLVKVAASGVNRPDIMQRKGLYPPPPGASDIPGLEIAGIVVALGDRVQKLKLGDQVCALVTGGGYAGYCLAHQDLCLPIPSNLTTIEAAGIPETFFTVWSNLFDRAQLQSGEWVLIHGGSSGIGTTAIQLAKAFGAKVIITAGSEEKCRFCTALGADLSINYQAQDFVDVVQRGTEKQGVNVILDMVGGDYFPRNVKCLAQDGRLLQIAIQNGPKAEINLLAVMMKRLSILGSTLRPRPVEFKAAITQQLQAKVWPLLVQGTIKPIIYKTLPLHQAMQAHKLMESSRHIGKIILTIEH